MRLIDADALEETIKAINEIMIFPRGNLLGIERLIKVAPTVDAVEVVRCRKCKYYSADDPNDLTCGYCDYWFDYHYENDFCNYGKKK